MAARILITGGAGFIGRHVTAALLAAGHAVRVLDNLHPQVHGPDPRPDPMIADAELVVGDIRDLSAVKSALSNIDRVVHLAAEVGVGQSMYAIERYTGVNEQGTAVLCQAIAEASVERVVTASSMSIYGEGLYRSKDGAPVEDARRRPRSADMVGGWDPSDADGRPLEPVATPEWKRPALSSVYALNKFAQEQMTHIVARAYSIESVALRLFNVYGPGQALSNPYTGVLAIFAARLLNGERPMVFEDGRQRRDFVHVNDVARAFVAALDRPAVSGATLNIGSGIDRSIASVAEAAARALGRPDLKPDITHKARSGDIRHCFADIAAARAALGFSPGVDFAAGLEELAGWVNSQTAHDRVSEARRELESRGLVA